MMKDSSYMDDQNPEESRRIDDIKQSIIFSGELYMRNLFSDRLDTKALLLFQDSYWSKRFAVIKSGEILKYVTRKMRFHEKNVKLF